MKFIIFIISIMFVFTGCAVKSVNNTDKPEPEEPVEPKEPVEPMEPAEGVMPEMPNVQMPEIPDVKMAVIPGIPEVPAKTESQKGNNMSINQVVEAACGQCQLGITEKSGCDLAIRIDGKSYFVDGTSIHDHGDAHADDGFCEAIRQANVKGEIIDGRFKAETFTIIK